MRRSARLSLGRPRRATSSARRACRAGGGGASGVNALCIPFLLLIFYLLHYVIKIWMNQGQGALMFIFLERWKSVSWVFFELDVCFFWCWYFALKFTRTLEFSLNNLLILSCIRQSIFWPKVLAMHLKEPLTLIGMKQGTFQPLSFLNQTLSADLEDKCSNFP